MNHEVSCYIDRLKVEIKKNFNDGIVVAYIEIEPPILTMEGKDDTSLVACDLWCDDPSSAYDINILIKGVADFSVLDTPVVTTLDEAKSLALIIGQQVSSYKISA
ncbi:MULTISPECIES: hypothetical protein [Enterobacter cloacae complex]|uniref:hypothetical protein n=1 Tax=Enterobacter cloacae complex TaxID=354276 RepID=UPI0013D7D873|nr:hypothetical protein [Enterobacter kobei]HAS1737239.1 hypothetical protein [Enterobacter cloacae]HBU6801949.1 hypothetical protein [Enterobacter hormaechei]HCB2126554.1 hypothetical protein [Enterobacter cloacae]HDQ2829468.1 hypothetical protein [Enterobacter cloacae]